MTAPHLTPLPDLARFLTPEALAEVRSRQAKADQAAEIEVPKGSPLSYQQAARLSDSQWKRAFGRNGQAFVALIEEHRQAVDGTEIAARLFDLFLDLHSYAITLFAGSAPDPKGQFRQKGAEIMAHIWGNLHRTIVASLEEAEPLIRREYQQQLNAYLSMIDAANAEVTTERRRADAAERALVTLKAEHLNELDTAVWRANQASTGEVKAAKRNRRLAEEHAEAGQAELSLLRAEVACLSSRERELEAQLADTPPASFRKEAGPSAPEVLVIASALEGMAVAAYLKSQGLAAKLDGLRVTGPGVHSLNLHAAITACRAMPDLRGYLREQLRAKGLVGA